jgi:carboxyl-terminal processing protease
MISTKKFIISVVLIVVLAGAIGFFDGNKLGAKGYIYSGHDFMLVNENTAPHSVDYSLLWQALDTLNSKYIDKPIDQQKALYGAISGAVASAGDPYTTFFDPKQYQDFRSSLSGSFEGIGAEVGMKNGHIIITSPLDGSPAKKAGILAGDVILKINGEDTSSLTLDQAVTKIRGPKGTVVKLTILRGDSKNPMEFSITRDTITVTSVKYSTKNDNGRMVEYINIQEFGDETANLFQQAATDAINKKVAGIILDLRDDPGGFLDTAVSTASYWIDSGKLVVSEAHSDGTKNDYNARGGNALGRIPTIVLINGGSASASEILAGALHDYNLATLVGEKSFGKGSVQELVQLPQNTALKVTIAKWTTPKGINLNHNGLDPDIVVTRTPDQIQNNQDPQLDKAMQLLAK